MAKIKSTVYLGFDDEEISPTYAQLNSTVNKIGGHPDWPKASGDIKVPPCVVCGMIRPLILQLYAPLEASQFHRTLYIFACLNPSCSQNSKTWSCIRTQHLDVMDIHTNDVGGQRRKSTKVQQQQQKQQKQNIVWCSGADDWDKHDDDKISEEMDTEADIFEKAELQNEENGNVIGNDNNCLKNVFTDINDDEEEEEDDDNSHSMDSELICDFENLGVQPYQKQQYNKDDPNANCASGPGPGCASTFDESNAIYAEIEAAETDVVLAETPEKPVRDLVALLKHSPSFTSNGHFSKIKDVTLKSFFIAVDIEQQHNAQDDYYGSNLSEDHIREIYQEYKRQDQAERSPNGSNAFDTTIAENSENYEKTLPAHGDYMFHQFLTTIQRNPGQILRYTRDSLPLLIAPLKEDLPKCPNCNGDTICEVQILSTLISKLRFQHNDDFVPIEYGNVLVFTCVKSCWDTPDKMRYERIIVQAEK